MPIFATLKEIIEICWRERMSALKFGAVPFAINLGLAFLATSETTATSTQIIKNNALGLASLLIYASFTVAWYRLIVNGQSDVSQRAVFVITKREWRFFGWSVAISLLAALCIIPLGMAGAIVYFGLALVNKALAAEAHF